MFCILCADHINTTFREQITNISLTLETNWHTYCMQDWPSSPAFEFLIQHILYLNLFHESFLIQHMLVLLEIIWTLFYIDDYKGFSLFLWSAYFAFYVLFNLIVVLKSFYHFICFFIVYVKISFHRFCNEDLSCILLLVHFYLFSSIWKVKKISKIKSSIFLIWETSLDVYCWHAE